jgi:hypothetical protein
VALAIEPMTTAAAIVVVMNFFDMTLSSLVGRSSVLR